MANHELDITKEHCPMTFVKTKLKLDKLDVGDELSVLLRKGEPLENVPKSVTEQGNEVLSITHLHDEIYQVRIRKLE